MKREALSKKIICLGVDGLDPRLTRKYVDEGKMPNTKKFIERGSARQDLVMLGGHPTVTPPMWTTLATGAYACTHGITSFYRRPKPEEAPYVSYLTYNLNSLNCEAEQIWNCFAEAGWKTLVWHWPGSSWPPSSDSENLLVVDGTVPGSVNIAATEEKEFLVVANRDFDSITFRPNAASDISAACVIEGLEAANRDIDTAMMANSAKGIGAMATMPPRQSLIIDSMNQGQMGSIKGKLNTAYSSIKPANGWAKELPADALEFTILFSNGLLRRPCLLLKNADGIYDTIEIYKNKKESEPLSTAKSGEFVRNYMDVVQQEDGSTINTNRDYAVLDIEPDGSRVRMWVSSALDYTNSTFWHPQSLLQTIRDNVGCPPPTTSIGSQEKELISDVMLRCWDHVADWQADSLIYMLDHENVDIVFSHYHAVDLEAHRFMRFLYDKGDNIVPTSVIEKYLEDIYVQTDNYLGKFLRYLDEGATVLIFSDHAQVCPTNNPHGIGDITGVNVELMEKLGYTVLKTDENGNKLKEIDWTKTKAIAWGEQHIYLNLKSRYPYGIVEDEDRYELEEQIMTDLYGYKHPVTGKRIIAVALRNRDAVLLGQGGPEAGDIIFWMAEGYNYDHADCISTTLGESDTSISPIFIAAGPGIKEGFTTDRMIRQVDFAPTVAVLGGVRYPAQCEGAPAYQILTEEI